MCIRDRLHSEAVVRECMAQEPGLQVLNGFDERPALRRDHGRAAQLGLHVHAAEGLQVETRAEEAGQLTQEMPSFPTVQGSLVAQIRALPCVCVLALTTDHEVYVREAPRNLDDNVQTLYVADAPEVAQSGLVGMPNGHSATS